LKSIHTIKYNNELDCIKGEYTGALRIGVM